MKRAEAQGNAMHRLSRAMFAHAPRLRACSAGRREEAQTIAVEAVVYGGDAGHEWVPAARER